MAQAVPAAVRKVLLVEDDAAVRFGLREFLEAHEFRVTEGEDCSTAEVQFRRASPHIVLLDHQLPDGTALDVLPRLLRLDAQVPVVIMTGHGSIDLAVRALKEGAEHFLTKPVAMEALLVVLERAIENRRNRQQQIVRNRRLPSADVDPFAGGSPAITELREAARRAAEVDIPVVIRGETGTGKGVLARWLHGASPRRREAFVELNCAGVPRELAEAELFGYERGAFTGAVASKVGLLEAAHQGTVLLDEIAEMDLTVQAKLLKVVEDGDVRRLGDVEARQADIRLLAATHADLTDLVRAGRFREDLYYRLQRLDLRLPPLRERPEDIPVLARSILHAVAADLGRPPLILAPETERALRGYAWPGNIRELRNVIERGVLLATGDRLAVSAELFGHPPPAGAVDADWDGLTLVDVERRHIERAVQREGGNVERAARRLGISRSALYHKMKALQILRSPR